MHMPEASSGGFALFVDWIYRSRITTGNSEMHLHHLYDLYFLAEKLGITELKDKTMDAIQDMALKYDLKDELITLSLLEKVLTKTSSKMTGLRHFCLYLMVYTYLCRTNADPNQPEDDSDYDENDDGKFYVEEDDLKTVWKITKNDFAFFREFQARLSSELQQEYPITWTDPRTRNDEFLEDRCFFHCHEAGFDCRASESEEDELKFLPISVGQGGSSGSA